MTWLARQQQSLIDALFAWPSTDAIKVLASYADTTRVSGLKVYQANGHALAQRALQAAYPVVAQLVGPDSFSDLARAFWHACPPQRGDIAQWGEELAAFLQGSEQLHDEPYLPDVARVEWGMHLCASAAQTETGLSTLALLTTQDPAQVRIELAAGCAVVRSAWPVASILGAHLQQHPTFEVVGQQLRAGLAQDVVVWRQGLQPRVREATAAEAAFLMALLQSHTLAAALDGAPGLDFSQWLPQAVHSGLFGSVTWVTP
jgi:hypothetical protein